MSLSDACPRCGYPDVKGGGNYKGIYTIGKPCDFCSFIEPSTDEFDFKAVWEDLKFLNERGSWPHGIPAWAAKKAMEFRCGAGSAAVIAWAYDFVATNAMRDLKQMENACPGSVR